MYYSNSTIEAHVIIIILSTVFVKMFVCIQSCVLNYNLMYFFHQLLFWILYNIVMRHIFDPRVLSSYSFFKILQVANYFGSLSHPTQKACTDQILTLQTWDFFFYFVILICLLIRNTCLIVIPDYIACNLEQKIYCSVVLDMHVHGIL